MKRFLAVLLVSVMACVMLAGCGKKEDEAEDYDDSAAVVTEDSGTEAGGDEGEEADITGSWSLASIIDADGNEMTLEDYCAAQGVDSAGMQVTYTFNGDGTGTGDIGGIGVDITYEVSGSTVTITAQGGTSELAIDGETLTASDASSGLTSVFEKQ